MLQNLRSLLRSSRPGTASFVLCLLFALGGCASSPAEPEAETNEVKTTGIGPDLTLNLSETTACDCVNQEAEPSNFLEKGLDAQIAGDHIEAVSYFQRYQRLESSAEADFEAAIAIAFDSILPQSPHYDLDGADSAYRTLKDIKFDESKMHPQVLIMRDALETFSGLRAELADMRRENRQLASDLAKREEVLKRLRELTLGQ